MMTPQNALNRIKLDRPLRNVKNEWQYETEIARLQKLIDDYEALLNGIQALSALDQMNVKVLLQSKHGSD
jgi:hypothetical protein